MTRIDELTLKLLDHTIDEAEVQELAALTDASEGRVAFLKLFEVESQLLSIGRSSIGDNVIARIEEERCDRVAQGVMQAVRDLPELSCSNASESPRRGSLLFVRAGIAISVLAACVFLATLRLNENNIGESEMALLTPHDSIVKIFDSNGKARRIPQTEQPIALRQDEIVETSQAIDSAEIVYADGTRIELLGETRVRLSVSSNGSKTVTVLSGLVHAEVAPQPERLPLQIITRTATLEVLGTILEVEVRDASTQLGVATGRVAMTRKADGQRVEVEAGRYATATESAIEPLQTYPFPNLPTEWSEDFAEGLPVGWRTGELVETDDGRAVRAVPSRRSHDGRFVITSQNEWHEGRHGLCSINNSSVLHMRFRQSDFARITIMIGTRSYPPATGRIGGNLFFTKKAWNEDLPPETWKTISVPVSDVSWHVRQGIKKGGAPDLEGLAAYLVHVTTMDQDAGLVIDRIWMTNGPEERQQ